MCKPAEGGPGNMIHVHTLGASRIDAGRNRVKPTSVRKFAMLLHLSAEQGRPVPRAALQELIFPDQTERNAQHSLRELVYQLRQAGVRIESDGSALSLTDAVRCDYSELIARERPDDVQLKAVEGGFLPGYAPAHSEAFAEWFEGYRARAIFDLTKALLKEVHRARSVADWGSTERAARACLALDPLNEEATLTLAEVLAIGGSKAKAVKLLDDYLAEVGSGTSSADLRVPASVLKRRIAERVPDSYRPASTLTFVGREEEMLLARQCFERARAGERQCLVIGGEPGIGKSRLAAELQNSILLGGAETRRVTMQPHDARRPLSVFMELVPQLLQMRGAIGCSPESLQLLKRLTERQEEAVVVGTQPEDLQLISTGLTKGIRDLIESIAGELPLGLFIDDAQWMDQVSQQTLLDLMSVRDPARLLLVLATRDYRPVVEGAKNADQVRLLALKRLGDPAVGLLIDEMRSSTGRAIDADEKQRITSRAGGNPLFAILLARESSAEQSGGQPQSLIELLGRRLDVLDDRSRAILVACVAIGRYCTIERLTAVLEIPHVDLLTAVSRLTDAGMIQADGDLLITGHPLIDEVLRARSGSAVFAVAWHRAAQILEDDAADERSIVLYWEAADRWLMAGNNIRALEALRKCARHALSLGRPNDAVTMLERACDLDAPRSSINAALRDLAMAAEFASNSRVVRSAAARLELNGVPPEHDDVEHAVIATCFHNVDHRPGFLEQLFRCVRERGASAAHRVRAATWLLKFADVIGRIDIIEQVWNELEPESLAEVPELLNREFYLVYYSATERYDEAIETAYAMESAMRGLPASASRAAYLNIGLALWFAGRPSESIRILDDAFASATRLNSPGTQVKLAAIRALWEFDLGNDAECDRWMGLARAADSASFQSGVHFNLLIQEIDIAIVRGQRTRALQVFRDAEAADQFQGSPTRERWYNVLKLWEAVAEDRVTAKHEAEALEILRDQTPAVTGVVDFEASTACHILCARDKVLDAQATLRDFLSHRRQVKRPLSRNLQAIAGRMGITLRPLSSAL